MNAPFSPIPDHIRAARAACGRMDAAQRIAFAIELIRDIDDPRVSWHLARLGKVAEAASDRLGKCQYLRDNL